MKLSNIVSKDLLPDFAESISWVMNAFDHIIHVIKARSVSIDSPLTMESIEALTDEELQALYTQYGLALYYPDISRVRRNWMLYNMARIWRYLGTPKAVEFLCQYIFSDIDIELKVHDNGAFDEEGRFVNPDLVDVFDIEIIPGVTILPPEANQRILENVIRFSRNSQALRQIYYSYDAFVSQTVSPALPYNGIVAVENVLNEAVCEDSPEPPGPVLPTVEIFADSDYGWCCTSSFPNTINISSNYTADLYNCDRGGTVTGRSACDTSKKYSLIQWQAVQMVLEGRTEIEIESDTGYLRAKNVSNSAITFLQARIVVCSSSYATVEMVLDADNNRYNAFKYTLNGTDYYYVLDGTQTDWTDDLSSIGYRLRPEFVFALKWRNGDWVVENFDYEASDNYWYAGILTSEDASSLDSLGFSRTTGTNYGNYGYLNSKSRAKFEVLEVYEDLGQNPILGYDLSTLEFRRNYTVLTLWNTVRNATNLKSYLCRVTPPEPLVILFCVRWDGSRWIAPSFPANDWFYTGIRNNDDKIAIQAMGLSVTTSATNAGPHGNIVYDPNYNYEILALYSDIGQTVSSYTNLSNLSMGLTESYYGNLLTIKNVTAINSGLIMSYKLKITRRTT